MGAINFQFIADDNLATSAIVTDYRALCSYSIADTYLSGHPSANVLSGFDFVTIDGDLTDPDELTINGDHFDVVASSPLKKQFEFRMDRGGFSKTLKKDGVVVGDLQLSTYSGSRYFGRLTIDLGSGVERFSIRPVASRTVDDNAQCHMLARLGVRPGKDITCPPYNSGFSFFLQRLYVAILNRVYFFSNGGAYDPAQRIRVLILFDKLTSRDIAGMETELGEDLIESMNQSVTNSEVDLSKCEFALASTVATTIKADNEVSDVLVQLASFLGSSAIDPASFDIVYFFFPTADKFGYALGHKRYCVGSQFRIEYGIFQHEIGHLFGMKHQPSENDSSLNVNSYFSRGFHKQDPHFGTIMNNADQYLNINRFARLEMETPFGTVKSCGNRTARRLPYLAGSIQGNFTGFFANIFNFFLQQLTR